jgi:addiction module HigA family antidote
MRVKNPPHPGELVKANLDEIGLSVVKAAKTLGITRQQLYNVIGGKSVVTPEMAARFEKAFGGSADMWLRMQAAYDLARVRQHEKEIVMNRLAAKKKAASFPPANGGNICGGRSRRSGAAIGRRSVARHGLKRNAKPIWIRRCARKPTRWSNTFIGNSDQASPRRGNSSS